MKPNYLIPLAMMLDHANINQSTIMGFVNSQIWYTIDVTSFSCSVDGVLTAISKRGPKQIFVSDTMIKVINYQTCGTQPMTHMYIYKNTPIICTRKWDKSSGASVTMMTFNTKRSRKHIHEFIKKLKMLNTNTLLTYSKVNSIMLIMVDALVDSSMLIINHSMIYFFRMNNNIRSLTGSKHL
jgi:hypothetical protein